MSLEETILEWFSPPFDRNVRDAILLLKKEPKKLEDAFYTSLDFGTGGIRGIMGVGTNRINKYTLGKCTQGLSNFLKKKYSGEKIKTVVAYDCRNQSRNFAHDVADVLTANGIYCYLFSDLRPTPELSFCIRYLKANCGIVLTASHNPPEYNGYKVYGEDGGQLVPPDDILVTKEINDIKYNAILFNRNKKLLNYIDNEIDNEYHKIVLQEAQMNQKNQDELKVVFTPIHGTSITAIPQVLKKAGYKKIYIVKEQEKPDGNFSTVSSPNPEEKEALKMAVDLADKKNADIVIGTDPDADRLGIAIRDSKDDWYYLNGNQIMTVLTEYLLSKKKAIKQLNSKNFIASTIVSSPIIKIIANAYDIKHMYCLTGFKWIAKLIKDHPELEYVCGGEESFGFLVGNKVRDKDAISASLLACELASELKSQNNSIYKFLINCYKKYGIYNERLKSITKEGKEGLEEIKNIMAKFRKNPPLQIAGINTIIVEDYSQRTILDLKSGKKESISLPKSDVLIFILEDKSRIGLRPSGTEPKIKFYFSVCDNYKPNVTWEKQQQILNKKIDLLLNDIIP